MSMLPDKEIPQRIKTLSDEHLHCGALVARKKEESASREVLYHLIEVFQRKLHLKFAYSDIWDYVRNYLNYNESNAQNMKSAVRLFCQVKEAREALTQGSICFTQAHMLQRQIDLETHKKYHGKSMPESLKSELIKEVSGLGTRDTQKLLQQRVRPQDRPRIKEREKLISTDQTEYRFGANSQLQAKMKRARELKGYLPLSVLVEMGMDAFLEKYDPLKKEARKEARKETRKKAKKNSDSRKKRQPSLGLSAASKTPKNNQSKIKTQENQGETQSYASTFHYSLPGWIQRIHQYSPSLLSPQPLHGRTNPGKKENGDLCKTRLTPTTRQASHLPTKPALSPYPGGQFICRPPRICRCRW